MKTSWKALLILAALVLVGFASLALVSETPPIVSDYEQDCVVDERSDCAERCIIEHNCCIKGCNYVEPRAKSKCIAHCQTILDKCERECDQKPAADN